MTTAAEPATAASSFTVPRLLSELRLRCVLGTAEDGEVLDFPLMPVVLLPCAGLRLFRELCLRCVVFAAPSVGSLPFMGRLLVAPLVLLLGVGTVSGGGGTIPGSFFTGSCLMPGCVFTGTLKLAPPFGL